MEKSPQNVRGYTYDFTVYRMCGRHRGGVYIWPDNAVHYDWSFSDPFYHTATSRQTADSVLPTDDLGHFLRSSFDLQDMTSY